MLQIIVKGKLEYTEGSYLIRDDATSLRHYLSARIHAYIGKTIVISLEGEEPILNENVNALFVHEI